MAEKRKNKNVHQNSEKNELSWSFYEYRKYTRQKSWYIWTTLISLSLIVYAILTVNFLFALIVIMFDIILLLDHRREPAKINFKIDHHGIHLGKRLYRYSELEKFWIIYHPPEIKNLYLAHKSSFKPTLSIPLESQNPLEVKALLRQYLEEDLDQEEESFSDALSRLLKI